MYICVVHGHISGGDIQRGGVTKLCSDVVNIGTFISKFALPPEQFLRVLLAHLEFLELLFLGLVSFVQIIRMDSLTLPFYVHFPEAHLSSTWFTGLPALLF